MLNDLKSVLMRASDTLAGDALGLVSLLVLFLALLNLPQIL